MAQLQTLYPRRDTKHYGPLEPPWCTGDTLRTSASARVLRRGLYEAAVYSIPRFSADYQDLYLEQFDRQRPRIMEERRDV